MLSSWFCFPIAAFVVLGLPSARPSPARQPDTEQDLVARIQREQNPEKKSKYQTRLARVKLLQAIHAYGKGNADEYQQLLDAYLQRVRDSWQTLESSERQAMRQPQGFKELDIELREDARLLDDLQQRLPYTDRGPVEKTAKEVERIRNEVLRALFPREHRPDGG